MAEKARLTWHPTEGGRRGWICFDDLRSFDLGADATGRRFQLIADRMMSGRFYPTDAIRAYGKFSQEARELRVGDRVLQQAPLLGKLGSPLLSSAVEIYAAERTDHCCRIGYVTTAFHFGRGIWSAELAGKDSRLSLTVRSIASPQSWLFWAALPIARYLQLRARRRAVETFREL